MIQTVFATGELVGDVVRSRRTVGDLAGFWNDPDAALASADKVLYETQSWFPKPDGTEGAVLWASTVLYPGNVGGEYFMTRGHFHTKPSHGELIVVASGTGILLLMNRARECEQIELSPGVTYYIDGSLAHRTVNTGDEPLIFWCSWPADCGHDYEIIAREGFSTRCLTRSSED